MIPRCRFLRVALAAACLALGLSACGRPAGARSTVRVFAASSLTEVFEALAEAFESTRPEFAVELHCAGTPQLVVQLREGAPADLFASADLTQMQEVVALGVTRGVPRVFASNRLVVATAPGNPAGIESLADLGRDGLRVVLCGPDVPAGRYARRALDVAGVAVRSLSDEPSVKAVVGKILLGEVDAGIVYATDVQAADGLTAVELPEELGGDVVYPMATLGVGGAQEAATEFEQFVRSAAGRRILERFGFGQG